jgi:D-alanyl-D-alanine dipeptidase
MKKSIFLLTLLLTTSQAELPKTFSYIDEKIPTIELDIRYYSENNFIGTVIDGYLAPKAILTKKATLALTKVQKELNSFGLGLKVFDAYRPQKAVDHFVRWGRDLDDTKMKSIYYPTVEKKNLFKEGYIAKKSGHSRGSTVDLTIIDLPTKVELDMGSSFDYFGELSWVKSKNITYEQRANRMLLNTIMLKHGFKAYAVEWWHFTLKNEPYKKTYFNFDVQ